MGPCQRALETKIKSQQGAKDDDDGDDVVGLRIERKRPLLQAVSGR